MTNKKEETMVKTYESEYENPDLYVTLKCNSCGNEAGFYPHRVIYLGCDCGNNDYGNCLKDWQQRKFGNFTLINASIWKLPSMWEIFEQTMKERKENQGGK
jgi:anaerobic ribonucleoside-triphosphate reductase